MSRLLCPLGSRFLLALTHILVQLLLWRLLRLHKQSLMLPWLRLPGLAQLWKVQRQLAMLSLLCLLRLLTLLRLLCLLCLLCLLTKRQLHSRHLGLQTVRLCCCRAWVAGRGRGRG